MNTLFMNKYLSEYDLDYDAIIHKIKQDGGCTLGDEYFDVFKYPTCHQIYLIDYEVDNIYYDPEDLSKMSTYSRFACSKCGYDFSEKIILGEKADDRVKVTEKMFKNSKWARTILNK